MDMLITISVILISTGLFLLGAFVYRRRQRNLEELRRHLYIEEHLKKRGWDGHE